MKALIGITSYYIKLEEIIGSSFVADQILVSYPQYADSIERVGAVPVNLPLLSDSESIKELVDRIDGFIFCGGEDVIIRSSKNIEFVSETEVAPRDLFEMKLLDEVVTQQKPVLAICRGMQLLNIFYGGTLIQDIATGGKSYLEHRRGDIPSEAVHSIKLRKESVWRDIIGEDCQVNSIHHQAIKELPRELEAVAEAEDGIIEMVENSNYPFMVGVQWHPEMLRPFQKGLFSAFVEATLKRKN